MHVTKHLCSRHYLVAQFRFFEHYYGRGRCKKGTWIGFQAAFCRSYIPWEHTLWSWWFMTGEYDINLRKIQGQYTTLCLYRGGVWGICLWKIHAVKLISGAPLRAMDTSVFSHLSLKAAFERLPALYPNLQRASWDSRSGMRKCYHLCFSLFSILATASDSTNDGSCPSQTTQFVLVFIWAPMGGQYHLQYNETTNRS